MSTAEMSTASLDLHHPRIIMVSPAPSISEPELLNMDEDNGSVFTVTLTANLDDNAESSRSHTAGHTTRSRTSTIDPKVISDLLRSRPTIRRGKQNRSETGMFNRNGPGFRSVQYRKRPRTTAVKVRRRSSLPIIGPDKSSVSSSITIEDIEEEVSDNPFTRGDIHNSTRRIKDRLRTYQQNTVLPKEVRHSVIADFRYVKWPKIKSRLQVIRSWELWKGHIKEVEGHFGTAVVSYFIFLRWLFVMNIIIFALWFGFVVAPNIAYITVAQPAGIPSTLSCSYDPILSPVPNFSCIENTPTNTSTAIFYLTTGPGYSCNTTNDTNTFSVRSCLYEDRTVGGVVMGVAYKESPEVVLVSRSVPTDCLFTNSSNVSNTSVVMPRMVRLCSSDVEPHVEWYQYTIDFFLGEGLFNDTVLFYGRYSNSVILSYNHPLAFMILIVVVYAISVFLLVYNLGQAYNESYLQLGKKRQVNFSNKLFSAWDYNITDSNTAKLKKVQIKTELEEELADWDSRNKLRSNEELAKVIAIRIFTNLLTVLMLMAGGAAIYYAALLSFTTTSTNSVIALEGLVSPVIITAFNIILPFIFSFLAQFERFKTQSGEIKMTLFRTIIVRLASLIVLIGTLYIVIQCTQDVDTLLSTTSGGLSDDTCGIPIGNFSELLASISTSACPVCWETYIGQEFYKLALTNFIITSVSTIGVETARNVISRIRWKGIGEKIGKANFNIPKSILDLIYTQALLWLGFIFTPLSPAIVLATTFMLFYVKKYSLIWNLVPTKRKTFRAARTNFVFIALMLFTLFMVIILIGFAIASLRPSSNCGPFRGRTYMYSIITDMIADIENCSTRAALDYCGSIGFLIPVFILLVLIIYAQHVTLRARKKRFELIKKQLILEGANVTHIVGNLDEVLSRVTANKEAHMSIIEQPDDLKTRMNRVRSSVQLSSTELVSQL